MRGLGRKASFLAVMAVIAVALIGSGYALWFEDLQLNSNVATGTLDARITCGVPGDNENPSWPAPPSAQEPFASYPKADPLKDVAATPTGAPNGDHEYVINVSNTYPGYMVDCELHLTNIGTVPWHIETEQIVVMQGSTEILTGACDPPNQFSPGNCIAGTIGPTDPTKPPLYVEFLDVRGCQVHQNNQKIGSVFIGVNQSATEQTNYTIKLKFRVHQWNESDWTNCGAPKPGV